MKNRNKNFFILPTAFLDVLFNLSVVFLALLIMILIIMKTEIVKTKIDAQAEYIITMTWPEGDWDMDIWIMTPNGRVVFYQNSTSEVLNLERDDTGELSDKFMVNGVEVKNPLNQEIVVVRGIYPGEYIINVHLYRTGPGPETGYLLHNEKGEIIKGTEGSPPSPETNYAELVKPLDVTVKIDKINPTIKTIYATKAHITQNRQEYHIARILINDDGSVGDISTDSPVSLHDKTGLSVTMETAPGVFERAQNVYPDGVP